MARISVAVDGGDPHDIARQLSPDVELSTPAVPGRPIWLVGAQLDINQAPIPVSLPRWLFRTRRPLRRRLVLSRTEATSPRFVPNAADLTIEEARHEVHLSATPPLPASA
jgi:hypothetical protein